MKRILLCTGILGAVGIPLLFILPLSVSWIIAISVTLAGIVCAVLVFRSKRVLSAAVFLILAGILFLDFCAVTESEVNRVRKLAGNRMTVGGVVTEEPENDGDMSYVTVSVNTVTWRPYDEFKLRIYVKKSNVKAFDTVAAEVVLTELDDSKRLSYYSEGIYLSAQCKRFSITGHSTDFHPYEYAVKLRQSVIKLINASLPADVAGLLCGFTVGNTDGIPEKTLQAIRACGLSHTVAVSGLHMMVIAAAFSFLLARLKFNKRYYGVILIPVLIVYAALSGFSPSSLRSVGMISAVYLSVMLSRSADRMNILGGVAFLMMLIRPYIIFSISFLLSVTAVAGILLITQPVEELLISKIRYRGFFGGLLGFILSTACASFAATVGTFPVSIAVFGGFSMIGILANVLVSFVVTASIIAGFIAIILSFILGAFVPTEIIFFPIGYMLYYITGVASLLSRLPFAYISADGTAGMILSLISIAVFIGIAVLLSFLKRRKTANDRS